MKDTLIFIPAYNEGQIIRNTLKKLLEASEYDVLVVDDGSGDDTAKISKEMDVKLVRHPVNLGLGAAIETGLEYARREGYDKAVSFDADGQHNPKDIPLLVDKLKDYDLVIGVRRIRMDRMPKIKKIGNTALNILTRMIFRVESNDSQSGLRAFGKNAIKNIRIRSTRYEVSSEILYEAKNQGLKIGEVDVEVIYTDYSKMRGTGFIDGIKILFKMILHQRGRG